MTIEIFLNTLPKDGPYQNTLHLEEIEDKIRDLLISEGFDDFTIEDSYTGNTTTPHGGDD